MGYCSEVAFACPYEDFISLDKQLKDKGFTLFDSVSDLENFQSNEKWWVWVKWNYIKWYPEFEDVQIIVNYMKNFDNTYQFMRLGEDPEDPPEVINNTNEEDWFGCYRTIEVNI